MPGQALKRAAAIGGKVTNNQARNTVRRPPLLGGANEGQQTGGDFRCHEEEARERNGDSQFQLV